MSRTQKENIFAQSILSNVVWEKVCTVINMYKEGSIKDQKLNKKHLTSFPEIKQHHLQLVCQLPEKIQCDLLDSVINTELSLAEMKQQADKARQSETIKKAFVKCTNSKSWDDAQKNFPHYVQNLDYFHSLRFKNDFPEPFKVFCQSAISSKSAHSDPSTLEPVEFLQSKEVC